VIEVPGRSTAGMTGEAARRVGWSDGDLERSMPGDHLIRGFAVAGGASLLPEVLRPGFVRPRHGVAGQTGLPIMECSARDVERRVRRYGRDMIRRRGRDRDGDLSLGVALDAERGGLVRGGECEIGDRDMGRLHRSPRMAGGAVELCSIGGARVAADTADRAWHVARGTAERVRVGLGDGEELMIEIRGPPLGWHARQLAVSDGITLMRSEACLVATRSAASLWQPVQAFCLKS